MSKSLGNVFDCDQIAAAVGGEALRFFCVSHHYRSPVDFEVEATPQPDGSTTVRFRSLEAADRELATSTTTLQRIDEFVAQGGDGGDGAVLPEAEKLVPDGARGARRRLQRAGRGRRAARGGAAREQLLDEGKGIDKAGPPAHARAARPRSARGRRRARRVRADSRRVPRASAAARLVKAREHRRRRVVERRSPSARPRAPRRTSRAATRSATSSRRSASSSTTRPAAPTGRYKTDGERRRRQEIDCARRPLRRRRSARPADDRDAISIAPARASSSTSAATARSRTRRRCASRQVAAYVTFGGITAAGVALAATSFPVLVPFYLALGGRFLGTVRAVKRVNEASRRAVEGRCGHRPRARRAGHARVVGAGPRARARRAPRRDRRCARGSRRARRSIACATRASKLSPRLIQHQFSYYTEINLLTALGRTKEARARARGARRRARRRGAEAVVLDRADAPVGRRGADPPRPRRQRAPRSDAQGPVDDRRRAICCCCARGRTRQRGEHDEARFAWRQAKEREGSQRLEIAMPKLADVDGASTASAASRQCDPSPDAAIADATSSLAAVELVRAERATWTS